VSRFGFASPIQKPQQQRQITRRCLHQQPLVNIFPTSQVQPVHASGIKLMGEVPFDLLASLRL
jgi:hypothetical protein